MSTYIFNKKFLFAGCEDIDDLLKNSYLLFKIIPYQID